MTEEDLGEALTKVRGVINSRAAYESKSVKSLFKSREYKEWQCQCMANSTANSVGSYSKHNFSLQNWAKIQLWNWGRISLLKEIQRGHQSKRAVEGAKEAVRV